jgi:hypothetical protein
MTIRVLTAGLFALALVSTAAPAATCAGPNPAITSVVVKSVTSTGTVDVYHLVGTVTNLGSQGQPSNTLQFVDIYTDTVKHDDRGIPPLGAGKSYTFGYDWTRSADAGKGTTTMQFRIDTRQGSNCNPANGSSSITF